MVLLVSYTAFKSYQKYRTDEIRALESHHNIIITTLLDECQFSETGHASNMAADVNVTPIAEDKI